MKTRRFVFSFALVVALTLCVVAPGLQSTTQAQGPDQAAAACTTPFKQKWMPKGNCATNPAVHFLGTLDRQPLVIKTNAAERMRIATNGNVGIGTNNPSALLTVLKGDAAQPDVFEIPTALKVGTPSGTIPLAVRQNASESATPALAFFETSNGAIGSIGANTNTFVLGAVTGKSLGLQVNGATRAVTIDKDGKVGIGVTDPYARLTIKVGDTSGGTVILSATNATNSNLFSVYGNGEIAVGKLLNAPVSRHVCLNGNVLSDCNATAQYVPSIDDGSGFPETAELVSIAPTLKNPSGGAETPFAVRKSATACDSNLLGIIVKPELGADGVKENEHSLPLALSGNHAVKVTMENGFIRRGDPLTSSSKPGYAMKATEACKTIGYALEDAKQEGMIQVFADLGENTAGHVAKLQENVQALKAQNRDLQVRVQQLDGQNAALEARLAALERALQVQSQPADGRNAAVVTSR